MAVHVLDSSALLALILGEPGAEIVQPLLGEAVLSAVNLCEVATKLTQRGYSPDEAQAGLSHPDLAIEPALETDALEAARLWREARSVGLSLGDRFCVALARRLGCPAVTADRRWGEVELGVPVRLIR